MERDTRETPPADSQISETRLQGRMGSRPPRHKNAAVAEMLYRYELERWAGGKRPGIIRRIAQLCRFA